MVLHTSGFFGAPEDYADNQDKQHVVIHVGGEQFHAAAVALIDYLQYHPKTDEHILKKILGRLYQYFTNYSVQESYITPSDRIKYLLNTSRKSELVESIAYVLRQLTVDELYKNPLDLNYRSIFEGLTATTPKAYLRSPQATLSVSALKALEQALGLPITLFYKEPEKELALREGALNNSKAALTIHIMGKNYYPCVKHKEDFAHVGELALTIKPAQVPNEQEGFMADILSALTEDNQQLLSAYEHLRTTLLCMNADGELTREQLINLYIALLPDQTNNASFLLKLENLVYPAIARVMNSSEQRIITLLASTLASWVVAGVIKKEQLFEKIENPDSPNLGNN